jgi:hypothetical protein
MRRLSHGLGQALPGILAVQHLLNLNSGDELNARRILPQPAVLHFTRQTAVFQFDAHAGAGRKIKRSDEAQTAFGDIHHASSFALQTAPAYRADPDFEIGGVTRVLARFEWSVHRLLIGFFRTRLHTLCGEFTFC